MILKAPGRDMMNILSRCVLALYAYDENPDDISVANVLRQCLQLISIFPMLAVYSYQSFQHYHQDKSLFIHLPRPEYSTAENILHLLREDSKFTLLEARVLDLALVLHLHHPRGHLLRHRYLFGGGGGAGQSEGTPSRRRQYQGGADVRRYEGHHRYHRR